MPQDFSFDVVSKVDLQVVEDCVHISNKEIANRFDFKGSISKIDMDKVGLTLTLHSEDEYKLKSVLDVLNTRLAKRGVALKNFLAQKVVPAESGTVRQVLKIQQGIPSDKAKEIVAEIKKAGIKVQSSIQGDQVRVASPSKDNLQTAIALLKSKEFSLALQFMNYR